MVAIGYILYYCYKLVEKWYIHLFTNMFIKKQIFGTDDARRPEQLVVDKTIFVLSKKLKILYKVNP